MVGTSKAELRTWFDAGVQQGARYMIVVCDSYDHEDYPVYASTDEEVWAKHAEYDGKNMQRIMEVYDLRMPRETQMAEFRAQHMPPQPGA
jgi:hypothetical protein